MRITESRLRRIIRSVIAESFEETSWGGNGNKVNVGDVLNYFKENNIEPIILNKREYEEIFYKLSNGEEILPVITSKDRVNASNLDYPIIVVKRNGEIDYVLDGNHRLQKAKDKGEEFIKVSVLDLDDPRVPEEFVSMF